MRQETLMVVFKVLYFWLKFCEGKKHHNHGDYLVSSNALIICELCMLRRGLAITTAIIYEYHWGQAV